MKNISSLSYLLYPVLTYSRTLNTNVCFSLSIGVHVGTKIEADSDMSAVPEGWLGDSC